MIQSIHKNCQQEFRESRPHKETILNDIHRAALFSLSYGWLRLDEPNNSTFLGKSAVTAQFLFISLFNEERARIWFRHAVIKDLLFTMDLSTEDLPLLGYRFANKPDQWHARAESIKTLTLRAGVEKRYPGRVLVQPRWSGFEFRNGVSEVH
jgi:hypothetical protein